MSSSAVERAWQRLVQQVVFVASEMGFRVSCLRVHIGDCRQSAKAARAHSWLAHEDRLGSKVSMGSTKEAAGVVC